METTEIKDPEIIRELDVLKDRIRNLEERNQQKKLFEPEPVAEIIPSEKEVRRNLLKPLLSVLFFTMVLMTIYEVLKQWIAPNITIWTSHTITIIFASVVAPIGAYFAIKQIEFLRLKALGEIGERVKAETALRETHDILEDRVEERTAQLSDLNAHLKKEIKMRMEAEEELRKYAEQLLINKDLLENKANELSEVNEQLQKSEGELREMNKSKDKFFSILAHDLRSPFTSLLGLSEFLENEIETLQTEEVQKIVMSISSSSKKVYRLLENLLQWSRIQTGRLDFTPDYFDPNEIVHDIVELYKINAAKKEIKISTSFEKNLSVFADRNMIDTVLRNLLSNAIKFTKTGGSIELCTNKVENAVKISVKDTGIGISKKELISLFSLECNSTRLGTENEKGTGLGLVLCKEFVEKNKGKIEVDSKTNRGSIFSFTIPVKKPAILSNPENN